jgi:hypothetical protein
LWGFNDTTPTFCGARGCVVALRLPQLGRKGFCLLLVLGPLLLLGSCDSVERLELLAAWLLLLSNVDGRPLQHSSSATQQRHERQQERSITDAGPISTPPSLSKHPACGHSLPDDCMQGAARCMTAPPAKPAQAAMQLPREHAADCMCGFVVLLVPRAHPPVQTTLLPSLEACQKLAGCWKDRRSTCSPIDFARWPRIGVRAAARSAVWHQSTTSAKPPCAPPLAHACPIQSSAHPILATHR